MQNVTCGLDRGCIREVLAVIEQRRTSYS
jgi:hypothetical protein